jgi:hypothetical protein
MARLTRMGEEYPSLVKLSPGPLKVYFLVFCPFYNFLLRNIWNIDEESHDR